MKNNTYYLNIFPWVLRMTNALDKNCKENQNILFLITFFSENRMFVR